LTKSHFRLVLSLLGLGFLIGICLVIGFGYYLVNPAKEGARDEVFHVKEGATLNAVAGELENNELITSKRLFLLWARIKGYGKDIKAGEYRLNAGMPPIKILNTLRAGAIITHPVTIPEGFTMEQIGTLFQEKGLVDKDAFLSMAKNPEIAREYNIPGRDLEGYLYPDTYHFGRGISARTAIDTMIKRFRQVVDPLKDRAEEIGMPLEDVIILASIVEKETGRGDERPLIASVFLNRLKRKMRLESDPTVIYGIEDFNGNLRRKDLARRTPYNTYVIRGLPQGSIANPGLDSIKGILYPAETKYLYFVSKNDGSHYFSKNLKEHNNAVNRYQKKRPRRKKTQ